MVADVLPDPQLKRRETVPAAVGAVEDDYLAHAGEWLRRKLNRQPGVGALKRMADPVVDNIVDAAVGHVRSICRAQGGTESRNGGE